jgi:formylglycine-generating enzyme
MRTKELFPFLAALTAIALLGCPRSVTQPTDMVITVGAISGVPAPVTGATPVTAISETEQYTGTVSWSPSASDMFVSNTIYTATITLTAKAGYTLTGVTADFFTVHGTTSNANSADSGVVTTGFPATTANLAAVTDYTGTGIGTLKAVQGGTFNNGTANMTVSSFRLSQHEVTGEQYAAVMVVTDPSGFASVTDNPVELVTWYDVVEFCNKLSTNEGLTPVYTITARTPAAGYPITEATVSADWSANGYRLPTEAEWQFAARGGDSSHDYTYAGSNTIDDVAWYYMNSGSTTQAVGGKVENELGLKDMSGNVTEWCWDWLSSYPATDQTDYRGAASSINRVLRGGYWNGNEFSCAVDSRNGGNPGTYLSNGNGFRVVRP